MSTVNTISPALVTERGARRLPRVALLLLCAAYVLPGLFGRDPWRGADLLSFAQMLGMSAGHSTWTQPTLGGQPVLDFSLLPIWLGAAAISLLSPFIDAALAARIPFALLLAATLSLTWYATFHLALTDNAQPLPFAFGGEADPVDYARAIADGALLAIIATLGLLQLGHETTPELVQLCGVSLYLYAMAAAPWRHWGPRCALMLALPVLAASGAPSVAMVLGVGGVVVCRRSAFPEVRRFAIWIIAATLIAAMLATVLGAWRWRATAWEPNLAFIIARQWAWFLWPAWPFVIWTLLRWRTHLVHRHIAVPLLTVLVALGSNVLMGGSDRALLLGLPGMAALAAFALPTFKRSTTAAIDWLSMFFFTLWSLTIWVIFVSVHTGVPTQPAANVAKLAPGFEAPFSWFMVVCAGVGTAAWFGLVRWRTGRHREALWKSLVLPASGVVLVWLLLMTLGLPLLDYARSQRPWLASLAKHVPAGECLFVPDASATTLATLDISGRYRVITAAANETSLTCQYLLRVTRSGRGKAPNAEWQRVAEWRRPTEREEVSLLYRRVPRAD